MVLLKIYSQRHCVDPVSPQTMNHAKVIATSVFSIHLRAAPLASIVDLRSAWWTSRAAFCCAQSSFRPPMVIRVEATACSASLLLVISPSTRRPSLAFSLLLSSTACLSCSFAYNETAPTQLASPAHLRTKYGACSMAGWLCMAHSTNSYFALPLLLVCAQREEPAS
jgi:hypothetical protein